MTPIDEARLPGVRAYANPEQTGSLEPEENPISIINLAESSAHGTQLFSGSSTGNLKPKETPICKLGGKYTPVSERANRSM